MPELATAWITLAISADNMQKDIRRELNRVDDGTAKTLGKKMGRELEAGVSDGARGGAREVEQRLSAQLGSRVGSVLGRTIGDGIHGGIVVAAKAGEIALKGAMVGAAGVAAVAVGGIGLALTKGFDRLKSIDQAKFKLAALGNDAASIAKIMDSALASVKGTAFGMDDAVTAAASAVAAGIKPGADLTKYLKEVGDAASIAGTNFSDMGSIFNKIQTSNKAYTDDLQQLSDRGLPIFQWLQKEYGVTGDALSKMVQDGKVDAAHFQKAIADNIGGAALKMGQSFEGSVQNAQAALGRLGAAFLAPIFGNAAGGIGSITDGLDNLTNWVNAHQPEIITFFQDMGITAVEVAQDIVKSFGEILKGVGDFTNALGDVLDFFGIDNKFSTIGDQINHIGDALITTSEGFDTAKERIQAWGEQAATAAEYAQNAVGAAVKGIGTQVGALPFKKVIAIDVDGTAKRDIVTIGDAVNKLPFKRTVEVVIHGTATGVATPALDGASLKGPIDQWLGGGSAPTFTPTNPIRTVPRRASGGSVFGAGSATSDSIPAWLSNGEHVWTAEEVRKAGGQGAMYQMRAMVRGFSGGGFMSALPLETDDGRVRRNAGPGSRTRNRNPGTGSNEIGLPDWSTPGQGWGDAPSWWWQRPIDPNDILFPEFWGQRPWGKHPLGRQKKKAARPLGFSGGGAAELPDGPGDFVVQPNNVMTALQFAQSASGGAYSYGSAGPQMFDCSGFMSAIYGIVTGKSMPTGQRYFTTESDFSKLGFLPGYDENSPFNIGVHNGGGGMNSHMAGTLAGMNVESGGSGGGARIGGTAAGALDPQFEKKYHLAGSTLTRAAADSMGTGALDEAGKLKEKTGGSSGGFDASSLGQSLVGGIMQSIGLDGSVFSDPLEWPNVKSGIALANWGGGMLKTAMGQGDSGGGMNLGGLNVPGFGDFLSPNGPQALSPVDPNTTQHGMAGGSAPGPINYNISGVDPKAGLQKADAHANQSYRRSGLPAVKPR